MINPKGTGRREIKATPSSRHVTFSKRRGGLFKKASELCALTGAECAILCVSPAGRVFAFGHPSVESVVDKYLCNKTASELPVEPVKQAGRVGSGRFNRGPHCFREARVASHVKSPCMHDELKQKYLEIAKKIEIEKNKSAKVKNDHLNNNCDDIEKSDLYWWEQSFEHLGVEELEEYVSALEDLMSKLKLRADDLMLIKSSSSMFNACKTLNDSNDARLSGLVTKDLRGQSNELVVNKSLDFSNDGSLNALLAIKDDELHGFFDDLELRDNSVAVPDHVYGDTTGN